MTNNKHEFYLLESPERIYNCDETGMEFDAISKFVCTQRGVKFVPENCRGLHEGVSFLSCVDAAGARPIPNLMIFTSQTGNIPQNVKSGADENVMFVGKLILKYFGPVFKGCFKKNSIHGQYFCYFIYLCETRKIFPKM